MQHWNRCIWLLMLLTVTLFLLPAAQAEVYINQPVPSTWEYRDLLRLTVLPTHQSDCMVLEVGGEVVFIDGGRDNWHDAIADILHARNLTHADYLFCTHGHPDHVDNMMALLESGALNAELFLTPRIAMPELEEKDIPSRLDALGIPIYTLEDRQEIALGKALLRMYAWEGGECVNDRSAMLHISFGDSTILLTSDIEGAGQQHYARTLGTALQADILKMPHHGLGGIVANFLTAVNPQAAVLTNDEKHSYQQLVFLHFRKIPYLFNEDHIIVLETDGTDWYITEENYTTTEEEAP